MNIGRSLTNAARREPDRTAIVWGDRRISYDEFARRAAALSHGLADHGAVRGDRVVLMMQNRPELLETMFACFRAGFCVVPLNMRFQADEVRYHVEDSGARVVITDPERLPVVADAVAELARVDVVVTGPSGRRSASVLSYEELIDGGWDRPWRDVPVGRDDLAWLFYTSGTTGRPKGAMLTHGNLSFVTASWLADLTPMSTQDVTLHAAPLSHGAGFHALATTARGACHVIPTGTSFDPAAVLRLIHEEQVTNTWMVPTQIVVLCDHLTAAPAGVAASLRTVVYGGAPFAPAELRRALSVLGPVLLQLYAQGETPMTATVLTQDDHRRAIEGDEHLLSSAGWARPGVDVRLLDADDVEVPVGAVGEICVRGPAVMSGYWQRPDDTAETLRNGWLHTGDLGRVGERGEIHVLDRSKDMVISGGSNVYPIEIEALLASEPGVRDVAVVGLPDRRWGEVVVAAVVPSAQDADRAEIEAELRSRCSDALAGYKRPKRYVFLDALPRNAYGKVLKRELRELLQAETAGQGGG